MTDLPFSDLKPSTVRCAGHTDGVRCTQMMKGGATDELILAAMVQHLGWRYRDGIAHCPLHAPLPAGQTCWAVLPHPGHTIYVAAPSGQRGSRFAMRSCPGL
jgi:hypothetical protein